MKIERLPERVVPTLIRDAVNALIDAHNNDYGGIQKCPAKEVCSKCGKEVSHE